MIWKKSLTMRLMPLYFPDMHENDFTEFTSKTSMLPNNWAESYTTLYGLEEQACFCVTRFQILSCMKKFRDLAQNKKFMRDLHEYEQYRFVRKFTATCST